MATDYPSLLNKLRGSMTRAIHNQEYHRLMDLDIAVRQCVTQAMSACESNESLKKQVAGELQELLGTYRQVTETCQERSRALKSEAQQLGHSKKGAHQYLVVAGKM
jgi:hypothetical protein